MIKRDESYLEHIQWMIEDLEEEMRKTNQTIKVLKGLYDKEAKKK